MEGQRLGVTLRRTTRQWVCVAWHDVGWQLLVILPRQREMSTYGERHHRRVIGHGIGAQAGIAVVALHSQT